MITYMYILYIYMIYFIYYIHIIIIISIWSPHEEKCRLAGVLAATRQGDTGSTCRSSWLSRRSYDLCLFCLKSWETLSSILLSDWTVNRTTCSLMMVSDFSMRIVVQPFQRLPENHPWKQHLICLVHDCFIMASIISSLSPRIPMLHHWDKLTVSQDTPAHLGSGQVQEGPLMYRQKNWLLYGKESNSAQPQVDGV